MKILVTYQSKTGFTQKYAQWIAKALDCDCKSTSKLGKQDFIENDLIIHGGWIMGGMVSGLGKIRNFNPRKLIVFGVGCTSKDEVNKEEWAQANKLGDIPFFYYVGGMNPDKMGFFSKRIVKMVQKKKPEYSDNTNEEDIEELVKFVKSLGE